MNLLTIYRVMYMARQIDKVSREITKRGEAFFHLSGAGHEGSIAVAPHLSPDDWLHCHYRDKALLLARGITPRHFFDSMRCNGGAQSRGRRMSAFFSDRRLRILSMVTPTGNNALQAVGVAAAVKDEVSNPIVYCGIGDGTTQQGEVLEAISEAVREQLPVLFTIQNNQLAISTQTNQRTFFSLPGREAEEFLGIPIERIDGRDVQTAVARFGAVADEMRSTRSPRIVILEVDRLSDHTNADDQLVYRGAEELRHAAESGDPIAHLRLELVKAGHDEQQIDQIESEVNDEVADAENESRETDAPVTTHVVKKQLNVELTHPSKEVRGDTENRDLTMCAAIRDVLENHLSNDPNVYLQGQDIEDPKGDVFGVTRGLSTKFEGRVRNAPLSESTIVGTSIGRSLAGQRPVAFVQFADFLPLAYNQMTLELATMHWRTDGDWQAPVIVMAACGGYRPGLGPYHGQTFESTAAQMHGIDVFMPSCATDAAGMLNAAFLSQRPTLYLYPKALLNDPAIATSREISSHFTPIGTARKTRVGRDITLVGWGNTVARCERAAKDLERAGVDAEVIDLRCISPWDRKTVLSSAEKTSRLIVVHEDNNTCGIGGEILATVAEESRFPIAMRRLTRPDTFIPCNYDNQIDLLPSYPAILGAAAEMLDMELQWEEKETAPEGLYDLPAIGSAPSDEQVTLVEYLVSPGTHVERGDAVATVEASKSVFEISAPVSGEVAQLMVEEGDSVAVGDPLMRLKSDEAPTAMTHHQVEEPGVAKLTRRKPKERLILHSRTETHREFDVGMSSVHAITGGREVSNQELLLATTEMSPADVVRLTGIETRHWADHQDNPVNMAVRACQKTLDREELTVDQIDLVVCSTTSPTSVTPSMACQVLNGLTENRNGAMVQAYDINAACSGYLYALQSGYDFLQSRPHARVLVVTTEVLSPVLDRNDLDTAILFGDASSATVLYGEAHFDQARARLFRPELSAKGEDGSTLSVPFRDGGYIQMRGKKVFSEAVRAMIASLSQVCRREGVGMGDLRMVVPHQANQRILDAIESRIDLSVYSNIRRFGNTSSSSIPLCLSELLPTLNSKDRLGLCAFGGGFTFGASIVQAK